MINPLELITIARDALTELPESVIFSRENLLGLIPSAISIWQERTAKNPAKRHNFIQESGAIQIRNGVANISEAIDEYGYKLEYIEGSDVVIDLAYSPDLPNKRVVFVNSIDRLHAPGRADKFYILGYLLGTTITFHNPIAAVGEDATTTLNSRFKLRSVVMPNDLADIPESVAPEIGLIIAEIAKGQFRQQNKGLDLNPK